MARTKKEKVKMLDSYKKGIASSKGVIIVKPSRLTPNELNQFRRDLFDFGTTINFVKNSIFKIALKDANLPEIEDLNMGEHAVIFLKEDIASPAKFLKKFIESTTSKNGETKIEIVSGILDNVLISKEVVIELSEMPDIKGSISMILGILDQAIAGVANVLEDPVRSYVSILDQKFGSTQ